MKCHIFVNAWNVDYRNTLNDLLEKTMGLHIKFEEIIVVFLGPQCMETSMELKGEISRAICWVDEFYHLEHCLYALERLKLSNGCIVFPNDSWGTEMAVRFAIRAKGTAMTGVEQLSMKQNDLVAQKRIASGNLIGEYRIQEMPLCMSMAKLSSNSSVRKIKAVKVELVPITQWNMGLKKNDVVVVKEVKREKQEELLNAKRILVIGGGVKKQEDVELLKGVATKIGAQIAGTRPVVMQGLLSMNRLIGVSGNVVRPELSIVVGASGMAGFFGGIENSTKIISINKDSDALITKKSDQILVADWKQVMWKEV